MVVTDWITGLAMREYVERRFGRPKDSARLERTRLQARA
jgi:hypothetical protein